jgi:Protein of unknown function, DUF547
MKKLGYQALFGLLFISLSVKASSISDFIPKSDAFFKKYVKNGAVAYKSIGQNITEIELLYKMVAETNLVSANDAAKKSFYINAYNVIVIYWVVKHYPLKSPLDDSGFFDKIKHKVAGEELTLNGLEIKKLLLPYKDGRFHFALACAAKSCPPLASFAYTPEKLDQQLNERASYALNNADWIKVDKTKSKVELSKIFEWYKGDFTQGGKTALDWINQFRKEKIPLSYKVSFYEYNWSLNEQ